VSLALFLRPTVSRRGIQFPLLALDDEGYRASMENIPSLSMIERAHFSLKPTQVSDAPGLRADTSPHATVAPVSPSKME